MGIYHAILRGVNGQEIFFDDDDYSKFCALLAEGVSRYKHHIHAYCLMPNHVHLVVQVSDIPLSKIMHNVAFRYASWVNDSRNRTGHLFQGRFKDVLVKNDVQLQTLVRYVHLNPVRAKMTTSPSDYSWSSHGAYVNGSNDWAWLTTDFVLDLFGRTSSLARENFDAYVAEGIVGSAACAEYENRNPNDVTNSIGQQKEVPTVISLPALETIVCRIWGLPPDALLTRQKTKVVSEARGATAWLAKELGIALLHDVAKRVDRNPSTLSTVVRRFDRRVKSSRDDAALNAKLKLVIESLGI